MKNKISRRQFLQAAGASAAALLLASCSGNSASSVSSSSVASSAASSVAAFSEAASSAAASSEATSTVTTTGKTVIPFCTLVSSGIGQSGDLLAELADAGTWLDGQRFSRGSSEADIASWVNGLNL